MIFKDLYNNEKGIPFDYLITYEIDGVQYERANNTAKRNVAKVSKVNIKNPSSVIACYSGEDMRLWHTAYEEYYNNFFNKAKSQNHFVTEMLYVNKYCWKIALLSLLCNSETEAFLRDSLGLDDIEKVDITFTFDDSKRGAFSKHDALKWFGRIVGDGKTVNAKTIATTDTNSSSATTQKQKESKTIFQYLYLLSMPEKNATNKVEKLITDISIKIGGINFDDLSEGEKKLILIECITKILGDKDSLLLLDEPDAHTHIARKKELLNAIGKFEGQTIMTTHSPVFQNMMKKENVYFLENGEINKDKNDLIKKLSGDELSLIDGGLYAKSGLYLLVEGKSDVKCIKEAVKRFPEYKKLEDVAIISFNGTGNAKEFYNQMFDGKSAMVKKIVFLFDYDNAGYKTWAEINSFSKCERLFYQKDYKISFSPTKDISNSDSVLLEDLFPSSAYQSEIDKFSAINSFHKIHEQGKLSEQGIKTYIENNNQKFKDSDFEGFKPLLDKLLEIYHLQ